MNEINFGWDFWTGFAFGVTAGVLLVQLFEFLKSMRNDKE